MWVGTFRLSALYIFSTVLEALLPDLLGRHSEQLRDFWANTFSTSVQLETA